MGQDIPDLRAKVAAYRAAPLVRNQVDLTTIDIQSRQALLDRAFAKYRKGRSLIGTAEYCAYTLSRYVDAGVDEVACLIDFGIDPVATAESLQRLAEVQR